MRTDVLSITLTHALSFSLSLFFASLGTQHPTTHSLLAHCTTWRRNIRQDSIHHGVRSTLSALNFFSYTTRPTELTYFLPTIFTHKMFHNKTRVQRVIITGIIIVVIVTTSNNSIGSISPSKPFLQHFF